MNNNIPILTIAILIIVFAAVFIQSYSAAIVAHSMANGVARHILTDYNEIKDTIYTQKGLEDYLRESPYSKLLMYKPMVSKNKAREFFSLKPSPFFMIYVHAGGADLIPLAFDRDSYPDTNEPPPNVLRVGP